MFDKSQWNARIMRNHPDLLEFRERTRPLHQHISFGREINAAKTESHSVLSPEVVLQILYQYLHEEKLDKTIKKMEEETKLRSKSFCNHWIAITFGYNRYRIALIIHIYLSIENTSVHCCSRYSFCSLLFFILIIFRKGYLLGEANFTFSTSSWY